MEKVLLSVAQRVVTTNLNELAFRQQYTVHMRRNNNKMKRNQAAGGGSSKNSSSALFPSFSSIYDRSADAGGGGGGGGGGGDDDYKSRSSNAKGNFLKNVNQVVCANTKEVEFDGMD